MFRRIAVVVSGLLVTGFLATGSAVAAPVDDHRQLTARDQAGIRVAGEVIHALLTGGNLARDFRY
ncbi:hypothetical protein ACF05W_27450 [Streptomyces lydicus]|uniref:hypothetical protein n=1 Tax=Streptomyces lydicus TaxID=47763 RepID=UPI003702AE7C